ncbi:MULTISPECIES: fatty acid--CoA ligase FadD10 [unclassified Mycolicibacterium]|uniref:fatty acid--CoA ligase FadD10 n=1 Tax=unclassified Mycolicibacterium TaxID=2636767 RepID=UPI0012DCE7BD|nr:MULTISPECIES: fatty acid--CoA ligase FadD10 [unclassified Mycolicibacterium]MUL83482.1 fatty acid--CoA ligase [Mycolicibacterium sp. CBMA 329]MUL90473.1 fatty acid--CoA ligase [Mycolicibacterium sp. CBMA 331]MUM00445.1 fatty acid--CoA ligase [Mycolicibacterium sp. CBMA 334]MUM28740.1 fatty acid--CoA ligase [Mycolicibacterium sp. CBMA 295]MUM41417.1 fatty acid--CoA ligase [Mycolicibacterium sp. CBMA 247]
MAYPPSTVLERISERARQRPEAIALRRCDGTSVVRYRDLMAEVDRMATDLASRSISPGTRVFVISDNGPETYLSVLACAKVGAIAVMVDGGLPPAAIDRFAEIATPGAVLIAPGCRLQTSELSASLQSIPAFAVNLTAGATDCAGDPVSEPALGIPVVGADHPLAMIFTSGTTGTPKAVLLPNRTFYAIADILQREQLTWVDWIVGETTYSPLPATHIGGLWWILNCLMQGGLCITGGENTPSIVEILTANEVATTCLVPTLVTRLVSELQSTGTPVPSSLRMVGYGGSRAVASDVSFVEAAGVRTAQVYGLSETGCTALCLPTDDGSIARIEAGAVGRPYPGVEVHLDPDGSGPPTRSGTDSAPSGTLWIKSPANMLGYWNNPDRTAEALVDGWVNTGDLLDRHGDGFFYIRGRSSEMIISGGVNIAPDEVDRIAEGVAGVGEAACYEIPDEEFGALVGLAVVASTILDESGARKLKHAIAARFRQESEPMARPSTIILVQEIPRTQSGKIMRTSLRSAAGG